MAQVRTLAMVLAAVAGGVVTVAGWPGLHNLATAALRAVPLVLIGLGLAILLRTMAPVGARLGPLVLIGVGSVWLAVQMDWLAATMIEQIVAPVMLWGGILLALTPSSSPDDLLRSPNRTVTTAFWPRRPDLGPETPVGLTGRAILGSLTLDLSGARPPLAKSRVDLNLTLLGGRIDVVVPGEWKVFAGRVGAARSVSFDGTLDAGRFAGAGVDPPTGECWLVVHVIGFGGTVKFSRVS